MFKKILNKIKGVYKGGLFHIFGSNVISNVFALLSSVLVVRFLPKISYGFYVDANNLYSYLSVFIGLGLAGAIVQFCSANITEDAKGKIYKYSFTRGLIFNFLISAVVILLGFIKLFSGDVQVAKYLFLMSFYPFPTFLMGCFLSILRVEYKNKEFSIVNIVHAAAILIGNIIFTYLWSIEGLIFSTYISQILAVLVGFLLTKKSGIFSISIFKINQLQKEKKKELKKYGIITSITNFTTNILVLIDVTCLGIILSDPEILADYHVATVLPNACLFIPSSLILYYYPTMVKSYASSWNDFKKYIFKLSGVFFCFALFIAAGIFIFSPLAIRIVYGAKYLTCVPIIRVLAVNYFICAFLRKLLGNAIAVLRRYEINLMHTVIAGVANIVLNIVLIKFMGSLGAAIATLCVTTLVVVMEIIYLISFNKKQKEKA